MDTAAYDRSAFSNGLESKRYEFSGRRENDRCVELRRSLTRRASPRRSEIEGELLRRRVARSSEGEDLPSLVARHLSDDVGRGAKAVDAELARIASHPQGSVADEPGAEQRRRLNIA